MKKKSYVYSRIYEMFEEKKSKLFIPSDIQSEAFQKLCAKQPGNIKLKTLLQKIKKNKADCEDIEILNKLISGSSFYSCDYSDMVFSGIYVQNANFGFANLHNSLFLNTTFIKTDFSFANLENCDFSGAKLRECIFRHANLKNTKFSKADILLCDFNEAEF